MKRGMALPRLHSYEEEVNRTGRVERSRELSWRWQADPLFFQLRWHWEMEKSIRAATCRIASGGIYKELTSCDNAGCSAANMIARGMLNQLLLGCFMLMPPPALPQETANTFHWIRLARLTLHCEFRRDPHK
jgi:hypothetical protein